MTNVEAIETLRANYPDACYEQLRKAVDVAIEALTALQTDGDVKTPCDLCMYNTPSSGDGKPCCVCPAERSGCG